MKKIIKLAVVSAMSNVIIFTPLSATLAGTTWYKEKISSWTMEDTEKRIDEQMKRMKRETYNSFSSEFKPIHASYNNSFHHMEHRRREQNHYHVEKKTYHYFERNKTTHSHNDAGDALAIGILGLAAGAILSNIFKKPKQPQIIYQNPQHPQVIYQEDPQVIYQEVPTNQVIYEVPSTATYQPLQQSQVHDWLQYCKKKYRSFNPRTGTFRGNDGREHVCYAPLN
ncbi:BA14K family protein [Bartonella saheliensis]|uniref:BA14K family protein n=1 Tax=Bartonella saheliensis TaxID=1457016 RepID=UPI00119D59A0|nr:BA14K family protein [Bartonella saheliensis]